MNRKVSFAVYGQPAPQGSKRHVGHGVMVEMSKKVAPWRQDVKAAALACTNLAFAGPLGLSVVFTLPKPVSAPKTKRAWPQRRPDLDKLIRSTLDGLTGVLFADDAQIVMLQAAKSYPGEAEFALRAPGAFIEVWQVSDA